MCHCCNDAQPDPASFRLFAEGCLHCAARRIQYIQRRLNLAPDAIGTRCRTALAQAMALGGRILAIEAGPDGPGQVRTLIAGADVTREPFQVSAGGVVVGWRLMRVDDLIKMEDFVARTEEESKHDRPGNPAHNYLLARNIVTIGGKAADIATAMKWVKAQPSPVLSVLREAIAARDIGYDTQPWVKCGRCGGAFRVRLPLDGGIFRRSSGARA